MSSGCGHIGKHEIKTCPRCGAVFECKVNNPLHCQCADVLLSEAVLEQIAARWDDCLCARCLAALAAADDGERRPTL